MSKYTTEVRFILEQAAGLTESVGFAQVDDVIAQAWESVFTSNVELFDPEYKPGLLKKILKHYYTREIAAETVGLWKLWMNERLEMIMPYYNQLYKSALIEFDPMEDVNTVREHTRGETSQGSTSGSGSSDTSTSSDETGWNLYSETPQGAVSGIENETYLTDARKITNDRSESQTNDNEYSENRNETRDEEYNETVKGKQGGGTYSEMLSKYRETLLNIDMQVVEEFGDLFMRLW